MSAAGPPQGANCAPKGQRSGDSRKRGAHTSSAADPDAATAMTRVPSLARSRRLFAALTSRVALLNGLTWRWIGYLFIASALFTLIDAQWWLTQLHGMKVQGIMRGSFGELWPAWFARRLLTFAPQLLALVIAVNLRSRRLPKPAALTLALFLGSVAGAAPYAIADPSNSTWPAILLDLLALALQGFTLSGVFVLAFFMYRHDAAVAEALQRAEMDRIALRKETFESGLQLTQARVEPQFLFDTLRGVGELYETNHEAADRMLCNLIVYLRAALPQMRTSTSTLGQEVQLVRAYLTIEQIRLEGRLQVAFDVPAQLTAAAFPPMVLLPLIAALALRAPARAHQTAKLRVEVHANAGTLAVDATCSGRGPAAPLEMENLRSRLRALYGAAAGLDVVSAGPHQSTVRLRVPHVSAPRSIEGVEDAAIEKSEARDVAS